MSATQDNDGDYPDEYFARRMISILPGFVLVAVAPLFGELAGAAFLPEEHGGLGRVLVGALFMIAIGAGIGLNRSVLMAFASIAIVHLAAIFRLDSWTAPFGALELALMGVAVAAGAFANWTYLKIKGED